MISLWRSAIASAEPLLDRMSRSPQGQKGSLKGMAIRPPQLTSPPASSEQMNTRHSYQPSCRTRHAACVHGSTHEHSGLGLVRALERSHRITLQTATIGAGRRDSFTSEGRAVQGGPHPLQSLQLPAAGAARAP